MAELYLIIPAKEQFLHLLRTVITSAAARADFSIDAVDDLGIAVDEAAAYLLAGQSSRIGKISLTVSAEGEQISAIVGCDAEMIWPPKDYQQTLAWKVLSGLTDRAEFIHQNGHPAINLQKKRSG